MNNDSNIDGDSEAEELANQILQLEKDISEMEKKQDVKTSLPYYLELLQKRYGNEVNVLKEQAIALVALSKEPERLKQIIADLQGIGGDSLEIRQLHSFIDENEEYHTKTEVLITDLDKRVHDVERTHTDMKIDIKKNGWKIAGLGGVMIAYIVGRAFIPVDELGIILSDILRFIFGT